MIGASTLQSKLLISQTYFLLKKLQGLGTTISHTIVKPGKMMATIATNAGSEDKEISSSAKETKFFKLSADHDNSNTIEQLVSILHRGGIVGLPTDTVYGVACLAQCTEAVEKLYSLKARNTLKPVAICVGETIDIFQWTRFPQGLYTSVINKLGEDETRPRSPSILQQLLNDLLPGPVTIVTERGPGLNTNLNPKTSLVGVRVPDYEFVKSLTNRLREPLALTSANISGEETSLCTEDFRALWPMLDAVVDGGEVGKKYVDMQLKYAREGSTVVRIMEDGASFKVLRAGCAYEDTVNTLQMKWGLQLMM